MDQIDAMSAEIEELRTLLRHTRRYVRAFMDHNDPRVSCEATELMILIDDQLDVEKP